LLKAARGVIGDVLVEGAGDAARQQDALDGRQLEGAEAGGVGEGAVQVARVIAVAQPEDAAGLVAPEPRWPAGAEQPKERFAAGS
jgi:hypothetical protein